ncbi:MAG: hypothetical protein HFJ17_00195 [Clostridia bacterium]|nr:hypothetical protein [Clostridia bacterium]
MDKQKYQICGIFFEINLYSKKYKIADLFKEPEPYNLYINYHILKCNDEEKVDERIIINDIDNISIELKQEGFVINTDISSIVKKDYNHQFSLFGNKGIVQKYILHILETKYNRIVFHGCSLINKDNEIIIGLGQSGSGKSALVNVALQNGWELLSTEQTVIDKDMFIYKGNVYDNISPISEKLVSEKLIKAVILYEKKLVEPLGQKIFVDMREYETNNNKIKIDFNKLTIINVNFDGKSKNMCNIEDKDYLLRLFQISASDKISFPAIIKNSLIDFPYIGNTTIREGVIDTLIKSDANKIILSDGFTGFELFFQHKRR